MSRARSDSLLNALALEKPTKLHPWSTESPNTTTESDSESSSVDAHEGQTEDRRNRNRMQRVDAKTLESIQTVLNTNLSKVPVIQTSTAEDEELDAEELEFQASKQQSALKPGQSATTDDLQALENSLDIKESSKGGILSWKPLSFQGQKKKTTEEVVISQPVSTTSTLTFKHRKANRKAFAQRKLNTHHADSKMDLFSPDDDSDNSAENVLERLPNSIKLLPNGDSVTGTIVLTNYCLAFYPDTEGTVSDMDAESSSSSGSSSSGGSSRKNSSVGGSAHEVFADPLIPLCNIHTVEKQGGVVKDRVIEIQCKTFQTVRFNFTGKSKTRNHVYDLLTTNAYPEMSNMFAFVNDWNIEDEHMDGWSLFDVRRDFRRMGLTVDKDAPPSALLSTAFTEGLVNESLNFNGTKFSQRSGSAAREIQSNEQQPSNDDEEESSTEKGWHFLADEWRITRLNEWYYECATYPHLLMVPAAISDDDLKSVFGFRSKGRIPALSWIHPVTGATITRCSQPRVGLSKKRCKEDEALFKAILNATPESDTLFLLDARPKVNANANQLKGAGFEDTQYYQNCHLEFCGIENIHVMRESFKQVRELCMNISSEKSGFWSKLESTNWLDHVQKVMIACRACVEHLEDGDSVLIHCSDGWDRTSQLSSVSMLCLDPYYRTIEGFCVLIEKEWLSFGHKFQQRLGHGSSDATDSQRSPIFVQFLDVVFQVMKQYPWAFEFNTNLLVCIGNHMFSCRYGTFLYNNEADRSRNVLSDRTVSLWTYVLANESLYLNNTYDSTTGVIAPLTGQHRLQLFEDLYLENAFLSPEDVRLGVPSYRYSQVQNQRNTTLSSSSSSTDSTDLESRVQQLEQELELKNRLIEKLREQVE